MLLVVKRAPATGCASPTVFVRTSITVDSDRNHDVMCRVQPLRQVDRGTGRCGSASPSAVGHDSGIVHCVVAIRARPGAPMGLNRRAGHHVERIPQAGYRVYRCCWRIRTGTVRSGVRAVAVRDELSP